ncbi:MAG: glycosyltransferase family 9 protein [Gammaproteobacteria bacterium]|nr:glycosyltransferase family 9 protein [Gammaproteobacteria bacterium]
MKILAVRNDRLGDFMLAWPAFQMLARNLPEARISVLVSEYTAPLASLCPGISGVFYDPGLTGEWANARALGRLLRGETFDAAVALFSRFDTALGLKLAGIPIRVAPATKLAQVFHTHRLRQKRSKSDKPEYIYNQLLAEHFLHILEVRKPVWPAPPYLGFPKAETNAKRRELAAHLGFDPGRPLVFIHPGHGGSSPPPAPGLFARIGRALETQGGELVITEGPADARAVTALRDALGDTPHAVYRSVSGLVDFARHLAMADLFVSGSTGPLHIAGALDCPTVAFYPRRRSATALRWKTLNSEGHHLAWMPPQGAGENAFEALDPDTVIESIVRFMGRVTAR